MWDSLWIWKQDQYFGAIEEGHSTRAATRYHEKSTSRDKLLRLPRSGVLRQQSGHHSDLSSLVTKMERRLKRRNDIRSLQERGRLMAEGGHLVEEGRRLLAE